MIKGKSGDFERCQTVIWFIVATAWNIKTYSVVHVKNVLFPWLDWTYLGPALDSYPELVGRFGSVFCFPVNTATAADEHDASGDQEPLFRSSLLHSTDDVATDVINNPLCLTIQEIKDDWKDIRDETNNAKRGLRFHLNSMFSKLDQHSFENWLLKNLPAPFVTRANNSELRAKKIVTRQRARTSVWPAASIDLAAAKVEVQ
jgi:hypothetical protein